MAPRRRPPKKSEPIDISKRLAESLSEKPEPEHHTHHETPNVGDRVTVGKSDSVWTVSHVYSDGTEVNLHIPGTFLERFRVRVEDLVFLDRVRRQPAKPPKPKIDVEEVREHIEAVHHSLIDHLNGEVAALKKWLRSKGVSAEDPLDEFAEATETSWKAAVQAIEEKLEE